MRNKSPLRVSILSMMLLLTIAGLLSQVFLQARREKLRRASGTHRADSNRIGSGTGSSLAQCCNRESDLLGSGDVV